VHILQFLKDWRDFVPTQAKRNEGHAVPEQKEQSSDPRSFDAKVDRLNIQDVRAWGNDALQTAAEHGHVHVLKFLKEWGLTIQDVRSDHNMALRCAAKNGHLAVCQFLKSWVENDHPILSLDPSDLNDDHDIPCVQNHSALQWAQRNGHTRTYNFLKEWETDANTKNAVAAAAMLFTVLSPLISPIIDPILKSFQHH